MNDTIEQDGANSNIAEFKPGDTVRVRYRVIEGNRERIQNFEGLCLQRKGAGVGETTRPFGGGGRGRAWGLGRAAPRGGSSPRGGGDPGPQRFQGSERWPA